MARSGTDKQALIAGLLGHLRRAWEAESSRLRFLAEFQSWRQKHPAIERFETVDDLISWFQNKKVKYEDKNPVAVALSLLAQEGEAAAATLLPFLFVPAFQRSLWVLSDPAQPDEVFAAMLAGFNEAMMTITPETEKPCGRLINKARGAGLSVKRDMIRRLDRQWSLEQIVETDLELLGVGGDPTETDPDIKSEWDLIKLAIKSKVLKDREADLVIAGMRGDKIEKTAQVLGMTTKAAYEMRRRAHIRLAAFVRERQIPARRNVPKRVEIDDLPGSFT